LENRASAVLTISRQFFIHLTSRNVTFEDFEAFPIVSISDHRLAATTKVGASFTSVVVPPKDKLIRKKGTLVVILRPIPSQLLITFLT